MNVDELQSVQSRERQTDSLQQLRESFYQDAGEFIQQLREERDEAAERAEDPFDAPEVNRLTDDIKTAEQTVEAVYERRVGKIVKMASLAAADMPTEEEGLTREERKLFETLVEAIESNRDHVLDVLAGEASPGAVSSGVSAGSAAADGAAEEDTAPEPVPDSPSPDTPSPDEDAAESGVDAADVMGGNADASGPMNDDGPPVPPEEPPGADSSPPGAGASEGADAPAPPTEGTDSRDVGESDSTDESGGDEAGPAVERRTVRITDDVGAILGVDEREYDLSTDDVVTLPAANADPLVERDAAEPLEK